MKNAISAVHFMGCLYLSAEFCLDRKLDRVLKWIDKQNYPCDNYQKLKNLYQRVS